MENKKLGLLMALVLAFVALPALGYAAITDTHKMVSSAVNYWDDDTVNISLKGNGTIYDVVFYKPSGFTYPSTDNSSCGGAVTISGDSLTCTAVTDNSFWVRINSSSSNTEGDISVYNTTLNNTLLVQGDGYRGKGNLIALPDNRTVRLIAGDEGGRRYFADSVYGRTTSYIGDDLSSFVAFISLEPTAMSALHAGTSRGIKKGNETHTYCAFPTSFNTRIMEQHGGIVNSSDNTYEHEGNIITTTQNKPLHVKLNTEVSDDDVFTFSCINTWWLCDECGGYVNVSDNQSITLNVEDSTPFTISTVAPATIGYGSGVDTNVQITLTHNQPYEIDDAEFDIAFTQTGASAGTARWVSVNSELGGIRDNHLIIKRPFLRGSETIVLNATIRTTFAESASVGTLNLTARAVYYPEWERTVSGGVRTSYRQEINATDITTLDSATAGTVTDAPTLFRNINSTVFTINGTVNDIETLTIEINGTTHDILTEMRANFSTIQTNLTTLFARFDAIDGNLTEIDNELTGIQGNLSSNFSDIQTNFTTVFTRFGNVDANLTEIDTAIDNLHANLSGNFSDIQANFTSVFDDLESINNTLNTVNTTLNTVDSNTDSILTNTNDLLEFLGEIPILVTDSVSGAIVGSSQSTGAKFDAAITEMQEVKQLIQKARSDPVSNLPENLNAIEGSYNEGTEQTRKAKMSHYLWLSAILAVSAFALYGMGNGIHSVYRKLNPTHKISMPVPMPV